MSKFVITGGKQLSGEVTVAGSKNAVLPLLAACLLTSEECVLTNVPQIKDVESLLGIFSDLGVSVERTSHKIAIKAANVAKHNPDPELAKKFRASILLMGPLLARMKKVELPFPGGDKIGARPVDVHLSAMRALGAMVEESDVMRVSADKLNGNKIVLEESSVTGTENAVLAAVMATGTTTIKLAAMEPHVQQLCLFLNQMGAKISGIGSPTLIIEGVDRLHGAQIEVIPDSEEAASLITMAAATKSHVKVNKLNPDFLEDYLLKLKKMNVNFEVGPDFVEVKPPVSDYIGTKIQCGLYPKLNSDYVPPLSVLATQASGETVMYEWLYENRLSYVAELTKMGAEAQVLDPHRVRIIGPTKLHAEKMTGFDLRMGMTLVIAALVAEGTSEISDIHHIDRGYENLEDRLVRLGADIKRIE